MTLNCFKLIFIKDMDNSNNLLSAQEYPVDEISNLFVGFKAIQEVKPKLKNLFLCDQGEFYFNTPAEIFRQVSLKKFLEKNIHPSCHKEIFLLLKSLRDQKNDSLELRKILLRPNTKGEFSLHVVCLKFLFPDNSTIVIQAIPIKSEDQFQRKLNRLQDECNFRQKSMVKFNLLSPREKRVLIEASLGESSREIAESLFISINTVETHKKNIQKKIGMKKRDFILFALSFDLIDHLFKKHI